MIFWAVELEHNQPPGTGRADPSACAPVDI
jgi:hypothetical protein